MALEGVDPTSRGSCTTSWDALADTSVSAGSAPPAAAATPAGALVRRTLV